MRSAVEKASAAGLVMVAAVFGVGAGPAAVAQPSPSATPVGPGAPLSWRAGPAPLVFPPARLARLSADRVLLSGSAVATCAGNGYFCTPDRDENRAVAILDTARGTSTRVADPPENEGFGAGDAGESSAELDGDVYFDGASNGYPGNFTDRTYNVVRYRSAANRWDLLASPDGIGTSLLSYNWTLAAGRPTLVRGWFDPTRRQPDGAILAPDGNWKLLPADPFAGDKDRPSLLVAGDQLLALGGGNLRTVKLAALTISAHGPIGHWRKLRSISLPSGPGLVTSVAGYLVWHDLVYDPRTGRSVRTPSPLRARPERNPEVGNTADIPDGLLLGDHVTLSGALFDPRTGTWTDLPAPPNREPTAEQPKAPHENVIHMGYRWVGGPDDLVRYRQGDIVTTGTDPGPFTITGQPGQVDVLRGTP